MSVDFGVLFDRVSRKYSHLAGVMESDNQFLLSAKEFYKSDTLRKEGISGQFSCFDQLGAG